MPRPLKIEDDPIGETITIEGTCYAYEYFRDGFASSGEVPSMLQVVARGRTVTVQRHPELQFYPDAERQAERELAIEGFRVQVEDLKQRKRAAEAEKAMRALAESKPSARLIKSLAGWLGVNVVIEGNKQ